MGVVKRKPAPKKTVTAKAKATVKKKSVRKAAAAKPATSRKAVKKPAEQPPSPFILQGFKPYKAQRGEEYMNERQIAHFRSILEDWKSTLMKEVERTVHHMQNEAANFPDPNDRASQESEFALELRTRDRERKLIKKIDESIARLDNDEYGYCEVCGIEIGIRRLEARPTATLCIDCKTLDEIRERQVKG